MDLVVMEGEWHVFKETLSAIRDWSLTEEFGTACMAHWCLAINAPDSFTSGNTCISLMQLSRYVLLAPWRKHSHHLWGHLRNSATVDCFRNLRLAHRI